VPLFRQGTGSGEGVTDPLGLPFVTHSGAEEEVDLGLAGLGPQEASGGPREAGGEVAGADGLVDVAREEGGAGGGGRSVGLHETVAGSIEGAGCVLHGGWVGGGWVSM